MMVKKILEGSFYNLLVIQEYYGGCVVVSLEFEEGRDEKIIGVWFFVFLSG